jgi:hypothetical protein
MDVEDLDELHRLLKKYEDRHPSDAAKYLLEDVRRKTEDAIRQQIL